MRNLLTLIKPEIKGMRAYQVPESKGMLKLDAMENPFVWPSALKDEWLTLMSSAEPNRYPDPNARELTQSMRACFDITDDMDLVLGNGSDELIQLILMAMQPGACIVAPMPSFVMYQHITKALGLTFIGVPLSTDFSLDMPAMLKVIKEHDPAVIFLAYPNNPTANLFSEQDIHEVLEASDGIVVVDEAYHPFAKKTFLPQVVDYAQLIVMRTVSKLGLAALRLGFIVGQKQLIEQFEKIRLPYNINSLTQLTATFAFKHLHVFDQQAEEICQQREYLLAQLSALDAVHVFPSQANFILFTLKADEAGEVFASLKQQGILIKNMGAMPGLPANCLRVTVGTQIENVEFIKQLRGILK